jgi:MFS family permease
VAFGIVEVTAGLMPNYLAFSALLIPLGLSQMTLLNAANATMQLGVDPVMRGRVMALYMAVLMGGTPFGAPLVGALAEAFGARWSLIGGGVISAGAALVAGALMARRSGVEVRGELFGASRRTLAEEELTEQELADLAAQR